jgi:outer membrane protein
MKKISIGLIFILMLLSAAVAADTMSLRDSIELAKKNSESIVISQAKLDQAEALAGQAFSAFLPQVRLDASLGRGLSEQPPVGVGKDAFAPGLPPEDSTFQFQSDELSTFGYSANLIQNIFTWGLVYNTWQIANLGADIAREEYRSTEIDLTYNVVFAYYGVLKARKALELSKESLDLANKHLSQTKVMMGSGVVTRSDVLRAELEAARSELAVSRAGSAVTLAENAFNVMIGGDLDAPVVLDELDFQVGEITAPKYQEFLDLAYRSRPDWRMVKYGRDISDKGKWNSWTGFLPMFSLAGSYGYNNVKDPNFDIDSQLKNWNIALVSSWTIFDGFSTPNKVREAYAKYVESAKGEDLLKKNIAMEVKDSVSKLNSAVDELAAAKKALELADENYKIAELRYSSGVGTNIEAIDAKTMLTSAKLDYLQSEFDYELSKADVNKAVGMEVLMEKNT